MNMRIAMTAVATVIAVHSAAVMADEEMVVTGQPPSIISSVDQQAISACMMAFKSEIQAAGPTEVRAVVPNYSQVFSKLDAMDRETSKVMEVKMNAYLGNTGKLLAKSVCTVSVNATVLNLSVDKSLAG